MNDLTFAARNSPVIREAGYNVCVVTTVVDAVNDMSTVMSRVTESCRKYDVRRGISRLGMSGSRRPKSIPSPVKFVISKRGSNLNISMSRGPG